MIRTIAVIILTLLLAYMIFKKPLIGLYCSVFLMPFSQFAVFNIGSMGFQFIYFTVIMTFISEFSRILIKNGNVPNVLKDPKYSLILFFFVYMVLSSLLSFSVPYGTFKGEVAFIRSFKQIFLFLFALIFYWQIVYYVKNKEVLGKVFKVYTASYLFLLAICIIEAVNFYFQDPITTFLYNFWHNSASGSGVFSIVEPVRYARGSLPRIRGLFSEASILGMYVVLSIFFLMMIKKVVPWNKRKITYLIYGLLAALIFSFSRSAQLMFVIGLVLLSINKIKKIKISKAKLLLVPVFMLIIIPLLYSPLNMSIKEISKLGGENDLSKKTRYSNLLTGINMFKDNTLFGKGIGNYVFFYRQYLPVNVELTNEIRSTLDGNKSTSWPITNNFIVRILSELGLVGFVIYSVFGLYILLTIYNIYLYRDYRSYARYYLILYILIIGFYFTNESFQYFTYWFFPGIIAATYSIIKKEGEKGMLAAQQKAGTA